ncbi:MAG: heavy metal translocating P-type ATPase [Cardiobacteriaceae bacterium]|nr:heavy metal translocating P-type ATPase [Cardiobacteriaceae bacterium]
MPEQTLRLRIEGMSCQACATRIEKVLGKKEAVLAASVNFANEEAQVRFEGAKASAEDVMGWIAQAGFAAKPAAEALPEPETAPVPWRLWLLLVSALVFLPGMIGMMAGHHRWMPPIAVQFAIASVVQLWLAVPFYKSALASIRGGLANMDVLVSLGTLAIYGYSAVMAWRHGSHAPVYFEAGVMVITLVSLGKFLEKRTTRHSLNSLGLLMQMTPDSVTRDDGATVALADVQPGDRLLARHGERIAADGILRDGEIWCDESHLTGESRPMTRRPGDKVLAGALVGGGSGVYEAQALGSATLLGDMMQALAEAQGSKAPIARLADKVAAVFVPAVLAIALLTLGLTWWLRDFATALNHAVAVLVIACPCALGLATPAAIMAGLGQAVRHGIWFRNAATLEAAGGVNSVVLDKTGTLTAGRPQVVAIWTADGTDEAALCAIAAAIEKHSNHPLAAAIIATAPDSALAVSDVESVAGQGLAAQVAGYGAVRLGKPDYAGVTLPEGLPEVWQIASVVAVSSGGRALGAFAIADALREDSAPAIRALHEMGIKVHMASGDRASVVDHIAAGLGIDDARGNLSPRDKAEWIAALKAQGESVAMVGDGINDAPALAAADLGLAMKHGTDIAENSAGATLMQGSPMQIATALRIARATLKNIRQNLFFAFFYNVLAIPFAAFGLLSPTLAAVAMALSSLSVVGNAMRLKRMSFAE